MELAYGASGGTCRLTEPLGVIGSPSYTTIRYLSTAHRIGGWQHTLPQYRTFFVFFSIGG
eukprot:2548676-Rhodomonas_salina.2